MIDIPNSRFWNISDYSWSYKAVQCKLAWMRSGKMMVLTRLRDQNTAAERLTDQEMWCTGDNSDMMNQRSGVSPRWWVRDIIDIETRPGQPVPTLVMWERIPKKRYTAELRDSPSKRTTLTPSLGIMKTARTAPTIWTHDSAMTRFISRTDPEKLVMKSRWRLGALFSDVSIIIMSESSIGAYTALSLRDLINDSDPRDDSSLDDSVENSPARSDRWPRSHWSESTQDDLSLLSSKQREVSGAKQSTDTRHGTLRATASQEQAWREQC